MANTKSKPSVQGAQHSTTHASEAMLATAFMTDAGAVLPKGMAAVAFRAPSSVADVLVAKPTEVRPLLESYGEAVAKSRAENRTVIFRVEVDPSGKVTVTSPEETASADAVLSGETPATPDAELYAALEEARHRGRLRAAQILAGKDMLSADQFAELLGTSRMTVNTKRQNRQVLGLEGAKRGFRFPAWQVGEDGKPFAALPALFERLGGGPWSVYRFLVQTHPELNGLTGCEALHRGKTGQVLEVAHSVAQGTFA